MPHLMINDTLTNNMVSFDQLGSDVQKRNRKSQELFPQSTMTEIVKFHSVLSPLKKQKKKKKIKNKK